MQYTALFWAEAAAKAHAKFPAAEAKVYKLYRERRTRGLPVSGHWLRARLRSTVKTLYPRDPAAQKFKASRKYLMLFCRRYNLAKRKKTNCKHLRCVTA
jgi:hypothetical protein